MTGFLNDLNLKDVPADPNAIPEGKHPGFISNVKITEPKPGAKDNHRALLITYKVDENHPDLHGRTKTEYKTIPNMEKVLDETGASKLDFASPEDAKHASYLKQRLLSLDVPESELDDITEEDLTGTAVWFTIAQRGQYLNVVAVEVRHDELPTAQDIANLI